MRGFAASAAPSWPPLERRAAERGNDACALTSTATARRFYLANGYVETGPPRSNFGTQSGFPMRKLLK